MRLVVISHKVAWPSAASPTGFATDGGFALQMQAISELFDETRLVIPVIETGCSAGEIPIIGDRLSVVPVSPVGIGRLPRRLALLPWVLRNLRVIVRELRAADGVHTPIPGDIGAIGMLLAMLLKKPTFVRHCGNWTAPRTLAEHAWGWLLERVASERTVVLATGGGSASPVERNSAVRWIFSTSLRELELRECATVGERSSINGQRLIIACRQERRKGTGSIIQALASLRADFPDISLDIVGDGTAVDHFRSLAETYNVMDRVRFLGKLDHAGVMLALHNADLFCFPTTSSEGFPKAVLEALACGLPVAATRVSAIPELLSNGGGFLLDNATPEEVARGIRWCLADCERYRSMSAAAIRTAGHYSLERWRDTIGHRLSSGWGALRSVNA